MIDVKALTEAIFKQVHAYVSPALATLQGQFKEFDAKIAAIPAGAKGDKGEPGEPGAAGRPGEKGEKGEPGQDVDMDAVRAFIAKAVAELPKPADGKDGAPGRDADPQAISAAIADGIEKALPAAVQKALDELMPDLIVKVVAEVPRPRDGVDGKDAAPVDEAEIVARLHEKMLRAVDALPKAQDGRDGRDAAPVDVDAIVAKALALIPTPKDGADGKDAAEVDVDAVVESVMKRLPEVRNGTDGRDGVDGKSVTIDDVRPLLESEVSKWALEFERRATDTLHGVIEKMPVPANGKDGRDALSVEDFEVTLEGRVFTFALRCGENVVKREIKVPFPLDRGTYRSGESYEKGDVVTYGGSQWIARKDTNESPPSDAWRLCVKKGKDGKGSA